MTDFMENRAPAWFYPTEWMVLACINRFFYSAMVGWEERLPCSCSVFRYHVSEAFLCFINGWGRGSSVLVEQRYGPPAYLIPPRAWHILSQYSTYIQPRQDELVRLVISPSRQCCNMRHRDLLGYGFQHYNRTRMLANDQGVATD